MAGSPFAIKDTSVAAPSILARLGAVARRWIWQAHQIDHERFERLAPDIHPADLAICRRVRGRTMTGLDGRLATIAAARYVARARLPGAIVECGVWRGGSMMAAALAFQEEGACPPLYLFDTFTGMAEPDEARDRDFAGRRAFSVLWDSYTWLTVNERAVRSYMAETGYPVSQMHFVAGRVEETVPTHAPDQIAMLRLDTDFYASTLHELTHLYPRLVSGGVLIIDDYGAWRGCRQAVDEYFRDAPVLLQRINFTGRLVIKP